MTDELFEHLKEVEPGRTVVPMYFIRRPLGTPETESDKLDGTSPSTELPQMKGGET